MIYWNNICVEAFCFGEPVDGKTPCGSDRPSVFCLENNMCPHLAYSETTERRVAYFPKLRHILKDRITSWKEELYWELRWWVWDSLWFNQRKMREFFDDIKTISSKDCPTLAHFEEEDRKHQKEFIKWFKVAKDAVVGQFEKEGER